MNNKFSYAKIEFLKMIQGNIDRMNKNVFQIKGLYLAVFGLIIAFKNDVNWMVLLAIIILFWAVDVSYQYQEKAYKKLYDYAIQENKDLDFKMNINEYKRNIDFVWGILFSKSTIIYMVPIIIISIYLIALYL